MKKLLCNRIVNLIAVVLSGLFCVYFMTTAWYNGSSVGLPDKGYLLIGFCAGMFGGNVIHYIGALITNIITKDRKQKDGLIQENKIS